MKKDKIYKVITNYFNEVFSKYPQIPKKSLYQNGAILYMNGNDGTEFDWSVNDRLCEFMVFYENEMGFIKVIINKCGAFRGYFYLENGQAKGIELEEKYLLEEAEVNFLRKFLIENADDKSLWDMPIDDIFYP